MRGIGPDAWSGLVVLLLCCATGTPVLFSGADTRIPKAMWLALFAMLLVCFVAAALCHQRRPLPARLSYSLGVVLGWGIVLTSPDAGWLPILLVFIAAMSAYLLPPWAGPVVIVLNSVVIATTFSLVGGVAADIAIGTLLYLLIQAASLLSTIAILREQRMRRELAQAHVELRAASVVLADSARAHERLRIARELHDLVGHQLTALTLELEVARHHDGAGARPHVERANRVARELLDDVRTTVGQLRADAPDLRESLASVVSGIPGLDISVEIDDDVQTTEEQTMTLIRVVQEIVTNTIRHADATRLRIVIERRPDDTVRLTSADDGRGASRIVPGNGLRGLAERVGAMGGDVRLDGSDGFRVTAWMPA
ncbi:signal transduction histidine kinase [Nonomuraea thailandensis]|uniref:Signal transduction histidine kinase n=1 Tax=Nonomuraea thailandensis TaxID=1188745 RepID=A0A9X2GCR2_9ACTN|nr:histidine kinase [Nonomuraea thailandensis]MCP2356541.1 signal transduction histidine kinase [Nonomuraea thailandensis]